MKNYPEIVVEFAKKEVKENGRFIPKDFVILIGNFDYYELTNKNAYQIDTFVFKATEFQNKTMGVELKRINIDDSFTIIKKDIYNTLVNHIYNDIATGMRGLKKLVESAR